MKVILLELLSKVDKPLLRISCCRVVSYTGIASKVISCLQDLQTKRCDLVSMRREVGVLCSLRGSWQGYRKSKGMILRCPLSDLNRLSIEPLTRAYY
jgi:hypothetical protein